MNDNALKFGTEFLGVVKDIWDQHIVSKSDHDKVIDKMHKREMETKFNCLKAILYAAGPVLTATAVLIKHKCSQPKPDNNITEKDIEL